MTNKEAIERLNHAITWDKVAERMRGIGFDPDDCDLGSVLVCVRKMMRNAVTQPQGD